MYYHLIHQLSISNGFHQLYIVLYYLVFLAYQLYLVYF
nr:MAG TPA: hypothetical protein [Caudoviricetes sp.]